MDDGCVKCKWAMVVIIEVGDGCVKCKWAMVVIIVSG